MSDVAEATGVANSDAPLRKRWGESDRFVPRVVVRPLQRLMDEAVAGGVVMLIAAVIALVWANSPWHGSYERLWSTALDVRLGSWELFAGSLQDVVNDGFMTIFFFVAALEIKRELVYGELRDPRKAALPAIAALGGMLVPAGIYALVTVGSSGSRGWGIPMATDIAFAVGVVTIAGKRVPSGARAFLLTLAIVDDIGGIIVIAVFYASGLAWGWLAASFAAFLAIVAMGKLYVRSHAPLIPLAVFAWFAMHHSGVHATVAGVLLGLVCPSWAFHSPEQFAAVARPLVDRIAATYSDDELTPGEAEANEGDLAELARLTTETMSPLQRNLFRLGPWASFAIIPVFAFANAGVRFVGGAIPNPFGNRVVLGAALGLVAGKAIGIFVAAWLGVRAGVGRLPDATGWPIMVGVATTGGVGFTVALFVANLSFEDQALIDAAKIGILVGSVVAGLAGYLLLRAATAAPRRHQASAGQPASEIV